MSPDGHMMLYASFNDSLVEEMHISWFGEGNKALYPDIRSLRYPKVHNLNKFCSILLKLEFFYISFMFCQQDKRRKEHYTLEVFYLLARNTKSFCTIVCR